MSGGTPAPSVTTTSTEISPEQRQIFNTAFPAIQQWAASGPPPQFPGSTIAPTRPEQTAGQDLALLGAGAQGQVAGDAMSTVRRLLGLGDSPGSGAPQIGATGPIAPTGNIAQTMQQFGDPGQNQVLQQSINAATRPIMRNLTENALPTIQGQFGIDNWGNSGRGLAEGVAVRGANEAVGDTAARMVQQLYGQNLQAAGQQVGLEANRATTQAQLDQQRALAQAQLQGNTRDTDMRSALQALGLVPSVQGSLTAPASTISGVGDVRQGMDQALLNEQVGRFNYGNNAGYMQAQELLGLLPSIPGATNVSTGTGPRPNGVMQGLGGAAAGASLGTAIMPGVGTAAGAGIGALLPFLLNR